MADGWTKALLPPPSYTPSAASPGGRLGKGLNAPRGSGGGELDALRHVICMFRAADAPSSGVLLPIHSRRD